MMLATLEHTKQRLRVDTDAADGELTLLIEAASSMVLKYLKIDGDDYQSSSDGEIEIDSDGNLPTVPAEVQTAVMYLVGVLFKSPDSNESKDWEAGFLPAPVTAMLYPLRDPTIA